MVAASPAVNLATPNNRKKTTRLYLATAWPAGKLHFCKVETMNILLGGCPLCDLFRRGRQGVTGGFGGTACQRRSLGPFGAPRPAAVAMPSVYHVATNACARTFSITQSVGSGYRSAHAHPVIRQLPGSSWSDAVNLLGSFFGLQN